VYFVVLAASSALVACGSSSMGKKAGGGGGAAGSAGIGVAGMSGSETGASGRGMPFDAAGLCPPPPDGGEAEIGGDDEKDANASDGPSDSSGGAGSGGAAGGGGAKAPTYIKASNTTAVSQLGGSQFGTAIAMSGDTLVVGAPDDSSGWNGLPTCALFHSGAAYVFVWAGGAWSQQAFLKARSTGEETFLGMSVAISGDTIVAGAPGGKGTAYVFVRSGATWRQQAYLQANDLSGAAEFGSAVGTAVAISGDTVVVGAPGAGGDSTGFGRTGAAYVYERAGTTWSGPAALATSSGQTLTDFGAAVAISNDTIVVTAPEERSPHSISPLLSSGGGYVFVRGPSTWTEQAHLMPSNLDAGPFGLAVTISGDTIAIGNPFEANGAAYVFARANGTWSQQAYVTAANTSYFGQALALEGNTLVVGAPATTSAGTGAVYVYERADSIWIPPSTFIMASNADVFDNFGCSVAIAGGTIAVGAYKEASDATGINGDQTDNSLQNAGAVYIVR
jgi:trimeric autotransporter adhesin